MPNPIGGISLRSVPSPGVVMPAPAGIQYDDDQFLATWGTFAFDNQLKNNERARSISAAIFSLVLPLTRGACSIEDRLAYLSLEINSSSERDKKRKMEDLMALAKHKAELQKRENTFVNEERIKSEQNAFAAREQNMNNALQQIGQYTSQEIQILSGLTSGQHEAIMNSLRQT